MNIEEFRNFCLQLNGVTEDLPFDENTLVFKVGGKMFCAFGLNSFERINLKCDPERSLELREEFLGIKAGYHMNKKHWNSIYTDSDVPWKLIQELTLHSYDLVFKSLSKKLQNEIEGFWDI